MQDFIGSFYHQAVKISSQLHLELRKIDIDEFKKANDSPVFFKHGEQDTTGTDSVMLLIDRSLYRRRDHILSGFGERKFTEEGHEFAFAD